MATVITIPPLGGHAYTTQDDGVTWAQGTATIPAGYGAAIAYNGTEFVVFPSSGNQVLITTAGNTLEYATLPATGNWKVALWDGIRYTAVMTDSSVCATSTDGRTWTAGTLPSVPLTLGGTTASVNWWAVASNGTTMCLVCLGGATYKPYSITSSDGLSWGTPQLPSTVDNPQVDLGLVSANGVFNLEYYYGEGGALLSSVDGVTYTIDATGGGGVFGSTGGSYACVCTNGNTNLSVRGYLDYAVDWIYRYVTTPPGVFVTDLVSATVPALVIHQVVHGAVWTGATFLVLSSTGAITSPEGDLWTVARDFTAGGVVPYSTTRLAVGGGVVPRPRALDFWKDLIQSTQTSAL